LIKNKNLSVSFIGKRVKESEKSHPQNDWGNAIAAVFNWQHEDAPKMVAKLLSAKIPVKINTKPFSIKNASTGLMRDFKAGHIVVTLATHQQKQRLLKLSAVYGITLYPVTSGLSQTGIDLGSSNMSLLKTPIVALLTGEGINSYQAGEVRYVIEQRLGMPVAVINFKQLNANSLVRYSHLILVNGDYKAEGFFSDAEKYKPLLSWVKNGGSLIAFENAAKWVSSWEEIEAEMEKATKKPESEGKVVARKNFSDKARISALDNIGGAIFANDLDNTNPLGFGYSERKIASFKTNNLIFTKTKTAFDSISSYTSKPLLSGYVSKTNLEKIAGSPMLVREKLGEGQVILFADDPNFRGYWLATMRLFSNSLFFSSIH